MDTMLISRRDAAERAMRLASEDEARELLACAIDIEDDVLAAAIRRRIRRGFVASPTYALAGSGA